MMQKILSTAYNFFNSKKAFYVVIGLLFVQAAWFALSVQYPIAFDESYHMGLIQFYRDNLLPFMTSQPTGSETHGDVTRYVSYLFHYLLSFPYRLIDPLFDDWVLKIIIFRFINIGIFIGALFLLRRLFQRLNVSQALVNFSLLMFVLVPLTSHLAATINYDNLGFLVVVLFLNFVVICSQSITKRGILPATTFVYLLSSVLLGSLIKYALLPIFAAGLIFLLFVWLRSKSRQKSLKSLGRTFSKLTPTKRIVIAILLLVSVGLFVERYGVNFLSYQRMQPTCETIRPVSECMQYGPWSRSYKSAMNVEATNPSFDPPGQYFLPAWVSTMTYRIYFAINQDFEMSDPLPLPLYVAAIVGGFAFVMLLVFWRSIMRIDKHYMLLALVVAFYVAALLYVNIGGYLKHHTVDIAVNGRYLILILPFLFVLLGVAMQQFAYRVSRKNARNILTTLAIVSLGLSLNGGGAQTYLTRSEPYWFFEGPARDINSNLQQFTEPLILGGGVDPETDR